MNRVHARRIAGIAALVFAGIAPSAHADAVATTPVTTDSPYYYTYGGIGNANAYYYNDVGNFSFQGTSGTLAMPGSFSLGQFSAQALPEGSSLTYGNIPFSVEMIVFPQGSLSWSNYDTVLIQGALNGTANGSGQSSVLASITSVQDLGGGTLPFLLSNLLVEAPQLLAPSGVNGGLTTLNAYLSPSSTLSIAPVPEPTSLVAFIAVTAAIGLRARRRQAA